MAEYGGFTFEMPQQQYDAYSPYMADVEQWQPSSDWMSDWTSMADYTDPYESGAAYQSMYNEQPVDYSATSNLPQQQVYDPTSFDSALAPEMTYPGTSAVPPSAVDKYAGPTVGQGREGMLGNEDDWWSKLAKAGLGMGVGAGTSALSALLGKAITGSEQQKASQGPAAAPAAAPTAPVTPQQYTPEPLEALPGTKASPLISGRPKQVLGSSGLKERKPSYGGFSMY